MIPIGDDIRTRRRPVVTIAVIGACSLVFLWQVSLPPAEQERAVLRLGLIPAVLAGHAELAAYLAPLPAWLTLFSSMFLHGGWAHLGGNMLYLWVFGVSLEDRLGHSDLVVVYLASGVCAAASQVLPDPSSGVPMIGASGAISGILGAYVVLFPRAHIVVFVPFSFMFIHTIQAVWLLVLWFTLQIASAVFSAPAEQGIAWWAHVGGFVAGMAMARWFALRPRRRTGPWG